MTARPMPGIAGVIGWPVAHSRSPVIHRFWLDKCATDGDYSRFPVDPARLGDAIAGLSPLGFRGVNVTVPHKEAVMRLLSDVDEAARAVGAVNTVVVGDDGRLSGTNTDVDGIEDALSGASLSGARICLIGAGGAARAALHVLKRRGTGDVAIIARRREQALALLAEFGLDGAAFDFPQAHAAMAGRSVLINASPLGMTGQPPMPDAVIRAVPVLAPGALVFDMVYAPLDTALLCAAGNAGMAMVDGLVMLIGQAARAFHLFFGVDAPRQHDRELRALLVK